MARGRGRWGNRDLRKQFPLPSERHSEPLFGGVYRLADGDELRFDADGTLLWGARPGNWQVHGGVLHLRAGERDCEGAIDADTVYLLCADGKGREARNQLVLAFSADA
jgi:hypothetical protein